MPADLALVMAYVAHHYPFTEDKYPALGFLPYPDQKAFVITHILLHMQKSVGTIADVAEQAQHDDKLNEVDLHDATVKLLINVLRLAEHLGITAEQLLESVPKLMKT